MRFFWFKRQFGVIEISWIDYELLRIGAIVSLAEGEGILAIDFRNIKVSS